MELHNTCCCQRAHHWSIRGPDLNFQGRHGIIMHSHWAMWCNESDSLFYSEMFQAYWKLKLLLIWSLKHLLTNTLANTFSLCCWDLQDCKHKTWPPIGQLFCTQWLSGATGLKTISHVLDSLTLSLAYCWGGQEIAKPSNLLNQKGLWVLKMCHGLGSCMVWIGLTIQLKGTKWLRICCCFYISRGGSTKNKSLPFSYP